MCRWSTAIETERKERLMAKMTKQQRLVKAAEARGFVVIPSLTNKAVTLRLANEDNHKRLYIGKAGSCRFGLTYTNSRPIPTRTKMELIAASNMKAIRRGCKDCVKGPNPCDSCK